LLEVSDCSHFHRLNIYAEPYPRMTRVALLINPSDQAMQRYVGETKTAATSASFNSSRRLPLSSTAICQKSGCRTRCT
jgi:hypothetical protein